MSDLNHNSRPTSPSPKRKVSMKRGKSEISSSLQNKFELKSSIPRPIPFTRRSSSATPIVKRHHYHQCLSANFISADSNKSCYSLPLRSPSRDSSILKKPNLTRFPSEKLMQTKHRSLIPKLVNRPKSASIPQTPFPLNNQYANVKAKVNSNLFRPVSPKLVRPVSPKLIPPKSPKLVPPASPKLIRAVSPKIVPPRSPMGRSKSPKHKIELNQSTGTGLNDRHILSTDSKTSILNKSVGDNDSSPVVQQRQLSGESIDQKQKDMMIIHNEIKELQSIAEQQVMELQIQPNVVEKPMSPFCEKSILTAEDSSEFLTIFDKRMEKVLETWLRFICDVISYKLMIGNSSLSRITLPDPFQDPRLEVYKFLGQMPTEGDNLQEKLQHIEEELLKVRAAVLHKVTSLWKDFEELKDEHWRLEKTQDQLHSELQDELEILSEENKTLDKKYIMAVDKYNQERAKYEVQEKSKLLINRDVVEMKKKIKYLEGKCTEWQFNLKKVEGECKAIEASVRNTNLASAKEANEHRTLFCKYNDAQETINELNTEILKRKEAYVSLEEINETLQQEINAMKTTLKDSLEKRNALTEELAEKIRKINDAECELNQIKTSQNNNNISTIQTVPNVLVKDLQERDVRIQELMKKLNVMENVLNEKSNTEEDLRKQVKNLQCDRSFVDEGAYRIQVKNLQYQVKGLENEKAELEKIVAQKSLELDQRDLLIKQNSQIVRARDELIPLIQSKQKKHKECTERLRAIVFNQEKNYITQDKDEYLGADNMIMDNMGSLNKYFCDDPSVVVRELSFQQQKMTEVYNLLEQKEMDVMRMERRLNELQRLHEEKEQVEREEKDKEAMKRKCHRSRGFFSMFTSQDYFG